MAQCGFLTVVGVCLSDPCLNGGTCTVDNDDYECSCVNGFSRGRCEIFTDAGTVHLWLKLGYRNKHNLNKNKCNDRLHFYSILMVLFKQTGVFPIHVRTVELVHPSAMMTSLAHVWGILPEVFVRSSLVPGEIVGTGKLYTNVMQKLEFHMKFRAISPNALTRNERSTNMSPIFRTKFKRMSWK